MGKRTAEDWETQTGAKPKPLPHPPNPLSAGQTICCCSLGAWEGTWQDHKDRFQQKRPTAAAGGPGPGPCPASPAVTPVGTVVCRKAPWGPLTCLSWKVLSLSQDIQNELGFTKEVGLSPKTLTLILVITGDVLSLLKLNWKSSWLAHFPL